jgi:HPt (histidine-containing phosphotransfer) domain-containing protein
MSDTTQLALAELVETIGLSNAVDVLGFALPHIIMRRDEIKRCLAAADWNGAARVAHKTISSVRVYGSGQFEQRLRQIFQKDIAVISKADFQQALLEEFTDIEQSIGVWLAAQRVSKTKTGRQPSSRRSL